MQKSEFRDKYISSSENLHALDFNTLRGEPLDLVGGGWSQTPSMYFFQVNSLCMIFFWIYDVCRIFQFLNITLELFCVFRNTEYNVSKYAHFSLYCFINYCEFKIIIVLKSFSNHVYSGP